MKAVHVRDKPLPHQWKLFISEMYLIKKDRIRGLLRKTINILYRR